MAQQKVILALDSGVLISAAKDERIEAVLRKWAREGAEVLIPVPSIAESIRGTASDATANRLIKAVNRVIPSSEEIARDAGRRLGAARSAQTIDALIVASAEAHATTDILTTDPTDLRNLASPGVNIIALETVRSGPSKRRGG